VAKLGLGELRLDMADSGKSRSFLVEDGFAQMVNDKLTILAAKAFPAESLTVADAEKELAAAERATSTEVDPIKLRVETDRLAKDRARARAKVALAKKAGGRGA